MTDLSHFPWEGKSSYPLDCPASGNMRMHWIEYRPLEPADTHSEGQRDTV